MRVKKLQSAYLLRFFTAFDAFYDLHIFFIILFSTNLVKRIYKAAPQLLLALYITYINFNDFIKFKIVIVVLVNKMDKIPKEPNNYSPICLLPAFDKILVRIIYGRISLHLTIKFFSDKQYG